MKERKFKGIYIRLLFFVKPYWKKFTLALICMIISAGLSAAFI